jgi:4-amino-4-deoxy-L-arabinose transferase-like glycosyltransferase
MFPRQQASMVGLGTDRYALALLIVGAIALTVRVAAAIGLDGFHHPHLGEYDVVARNLLAGEGFTYGHLGIIYHSYVEPLHVWASAASYGLTGSVVAVIGLQVVVGTGQALATSAVARRVFGGWVAPSATGMLVALHPGLIVYSASRAHPLVFDALLFTLAVLISLRLADRQTLMRGALLGLIVGLGTLSRVTIVLLLPVSIAWLLLVKPKPLRPAIIRCSLVACVCAAGVVAPWTIRTSALHEQFVFIRTTGPEMFWRGNNPNASGTSHIDGGRTVTSTLSVADVQELERQPDELAQAQWFGDRATAFLLESPAAFVRLTLLKFYYFWWHAPTTGLLYPLVWFELYMVYYVMTLALAGVGVSLAARAGKSRMGTALLLGSILLALSAFQSLFYVEGRHRWAVEPLVLVFSGGGVASLLVRQRPSGAVIAPTKVG